MAKKGENELVTRLKADIMRLQAMLDYVLAGQSTEPEADKPIRRRKRKGLPTTVEE